MDHQPTSDHTTQIQAMLAEIFQVPAAEVAPDLAFGDLPQWDSMGHMEVMLRLEEAYGVEVSADTIANLTSIPAILAYLEVQDHGR